MFEELLEKLRATGIPFEAYEWTPAPAYDYGTLSIDGGADMLYSDNGDEEHAVSGTVDLYVHSASTTNPRLVQQAMHGISWRLSSVQYEAETRIVHWEWVYQLPDL
ncbi:MAG: hypothetical protein IJ246_05315 [Clostridia bacterium]|nr:hypothetical protein [Clostridia bacterium]